MTDEKRTELDTLYLAWMDAEVDEQNAHVALGVVDARLPADHPLHLQARAAYDAAVERAEHAKDVYEAALRGCGDELPSIVSADAPSLAKLIGSMASPAC